MGVLLDSLGAATPNYARFTGTDLSRYNNALVGAWGLGDGSGSLHAMADLPGLPMGALETRTVTFGATGIIGTGTAMTQSSLDIVNACGRWGPGSSDDFDSGFTISFWMQTSTDPGANRTICGWSDGATSTGRCVFFYDSAVPAFSALEGSATSRSLITFATSYAADVADGNPHHIVFRYRNGSYDGFFDGTKGTTQTAAITTEPWVNAAINFHLGEGNALDGDFQHLYVWAAGLSDNAVSDLYNSGSGRFVDGT